MVFSKYFVFFILLFQLNCGSNIQAVSENSSNKQVLVPDTKNKRVILGAERVGEYLHLFKDKTIALVVNQTSTIGTTHVVDSLQALGVQIKSIFAPEHGFRGTADAGEHVSDGKDPKSGIPVLSIYGKTKKPSAAMLAGVDIVVFDIQDVGVRFYTYISSMHYVMEACVENDVEFMVLDRPNPNGHYVDGPILDPAYQSFVGMHPVPIVHGMTIGEYAKMVNGEGWLTNGGQCKLTVIPCENYDHQTFYELPIKPSPNLPDMRSIYLYPSICFFEGTLASEGRGTPTPFQVYGHPDYPKGDYEFTPVSTPGAKYPKLKDQLCNGHNLGNIPLEDLQKMSRLNLSYLIDFYQGFPDKAKLINRPKHFDRLAGEMN